MAKTRAEIQKAYRKREKATNNEEYLRKERERGDEEIMCRRPNLQIEIDSDEMRKTIKY